MNNEAVLAAIEQAKQALDQIEAECAKKPEEMPEEPGEASEGEGGPPMPMPMRKSMPMDE